jgi:hypothetical protein
MVEIDETVFTSSLLGPNPIPSQKLLHNLMARSGHYYRAVITVLKGEDRVEARGTVLRC